MVQYPRSRRRELRSEESRRDLVDAAIHLLAGRGMNATSTRMIAAEAGISNSAIFFHFGNSEGLYRAVIQELQSRAPLRVEKVLSDKRLDSASKAREIVRAMAAWVAEDPETLRAASVLMLESVPMPSVHREAARAAREWTQEIAAPFEAAMAEGTMRRVSVPALLELLMSTLQGLVLRAPLHGGEEGQRQLIDLAAESILSLLDVGGAREGT